MAISFNASLLLTPAQQEIALRRQLRLFVVPHFLSFLDLHCKNIVSRRPHHQIMFCSPFSPTPSCTLDQSKFTKYETQIAKPTATSRTMIWAARKQLCLFSQRHAYPPLAKFTILSVQWTEHQPRFQTSTLWFLLQALIGVLQPIASSSQEQYDSPGLNRILILRRPFRLSSSPGSFNSTS